MQGAARCSQYFVKLIDMATQYCTKAFPYAFLFTIPIRKSILKWKCQHSHLVANSRHSQHKETGITRR